MSKSYNLCIKREAPRRASLIKSKTMLLYKVLRGSHNDQYKYDAVLWKVLKMEASRALSQTMQ